MSASPISLPVDSSRQSFQKTQFQKNALAICSTPVSKLQQIKIMEVKTSASSMEMKSYRFYFKYDENLKFELTATIPIDFTVTQFIDSAIKLVNEELKERKRLIYEENLYNVYFAKKNGEPKSDLPALDYAQTLSETGAASLCLKLDTKGKLSLSSSGSRDSGSYYRPISLIQLPGKEISPRNSTSDKKKGFWGIFMCIC